MVGELNKSILSTKINLAYAYAELGKTDNAISAAKEVYTVLSDTYGPADRITLKAEENLVCMLRDAGKLKEAAKLSAEVYSRCSDTFGFESEEASAMMTLQVSVMLELSLSE